MVKNLDWLIDKLWRVADYTYHDGQSDAFGWAATYCRLMLERERRHEGKERNDA